MIPWLASTKQAVDSDPTSYNGNIPSPLIKPTADPFEQVTNMPVNGGTSPGVRVDPVVTPTSSIVVPNTMTSTDVKPAINWLFIAGIAVVIIVILFLVFKSKRK